MISKTVPVNLHGKEVDSFLFNTAETLQEAFDLHAEPSNGDGPSVSHNVLCTPEQLEEILSFINRQAKTDRSNKLRIAKMDVSPDKVASRMILRLRKGDATKEEAKQALMDLLAQLDG